MSVSCYHIFLIKTRQYSYSLCSHRGMSLNTFKKKRHDLKKFVNITHCTSIFMSSFMSSKSVSQIFKILFQTGDTNIFVLCGIFFSIYVKLKSSFSDEKNISGEIWDTLSQRSYWKLTWQSIKWKFHHWQKSEVCKVIHSAKLHWKR